MAKTILARICEGCPDSEVRETDPETGELVARRRRHVHLPHYAMTGPERTLRDGSRAVQVEVPEEFIDERGRLSEQAIRKMYAGQPKWDKRSACAGVQCHHDDVVQKRVKAHTHKHK